MSETRVVDNAAELRYELWVDDRLAGEIRYTLGDGEITLVHTEVEPALEGHGLGNVLVQYALEDIRARGLRLERFGSAGLLDPLDVVAPRDFEPRRLAVALERQDVRRDAVEEPAVVR